MVSAIPGSLWESNFELHKMHSLNTARGLEL